MRGTLKRASAMPGDSPRPDRGGPPALHVATRMSQKDGRSKPRPYKTRKERKSGHGVWRPPPIVKRRNIEPSQTYIRQRPRGTTNSPRVNVGDQIYVPGE